MIDETEESLTPESSDGGAPASGSDGTIPAQVRPWWKRPQVIAVISVVVLVVVLVAVAASGRNTPTTLSTKTTKPADVRRTIVVPHERDTTTTTTKKTTGVPEVTSVTKGTAGTDVTTTLPTTPTSGATTSPTTMVVTPQSVTTTTTLPVPSGPRPAPGTCKLTVIPQGTDTFIFIYTSGLSAGVTIKFSGAGVGHGSTNATGTAYFVLPAGYAPSSSPKQVEHEKATGPCSTSTVSFTLPTEPGG